VQASVIDAASPSRRTTESLGVAVAGAKYWSVITSATFDGGSVFRTVCLFVSRMT